MVSSRLSNADETAWLLYYAVILEEIYDYPYVQVTYEQTNGGGDSVL